MANVSIFCVDPTNIYLFKVTIKTIEKGATV